MLRPATFILLVLVAIATVVWLVVTADELREYDAQTAEQDLAVDIANGNVSVKQVCGFACSPPGIGYFYYYCYEDLPVETIDPTGDMISSDRHLELKERAREYASVYNPLALDYFDSIGRRTCPAGENWTEAIWQATDYVRSVDDEYSSFGAPETLEGNFSVSMRGPFDHDALMVSVCQLFLENGIERSFTTSVEQRLEVDGEFSWAHQFDFQCESGAYERL
ncbi:MAG: hypothetical protein AAAFM81_15600 [Pseudomonadota bacterium]